MDKRESVNNEKIAFNYINASHLLDLINMSRYSPDNLDTEIFYYLFELYNKERNGEFVSEVMNLVNIIKAIDETTLDVVYENLKKVQKFSITELYQFSTNNTDQEDSPLLLIRISEDDEHNQIFVVSKHSFIQNSYESLNL